MEFQSFAIGRLFSGFSCFFVFCSNEFTHDNKGGSLRACLNCPTPFLLSTQPTAQKTLGLSWCFHAALRQYYFLPACSTLMGRSHQGVVGRGMCMASNKHLQHLPPVFSSLTCVLDEEPSGIFICKNVFDGIINKSWKQKLWQRLFMAS